MSKFLFHYASFYVPSGKKQMLGNIFFDCILDIYFHFEDCGFLFSQYLQIYT